MNQNIRQRITGTIVLAITALILLPVIFDGQGSYQAPLQTDIPARPVQPEAARSMPQRPVITADTDAIRIRPESTGAVPVAATTETAADTAAGQVAADTSLPPAVTQSAQPATSVVMQPVAPALDARGLPEAWSVRLGVFSNASNASNLVSNLQQAGHRAYSRQINSSQGVSTAVFVGPVVDRAAAQSLMESLRVDFQLNGLIVRYEIEEL